MRGIDPVYTREFEEEHLFLYPHVRERLKGAGIVPRTAYEPDKVSEDWI